MSVYVRVRFDVRKAVFVSLNVVIKELVGQGLADIDKAEGGKNTEYDGDDLRSHFWSQGDAVRMLSSCNTLRDEYEPVAACIMKFEMLRASFFDRPTLEVAPDLLGKWLVRTGIEERPLVGRIVETEAYTGDDPAFHAWGIVDPPTGLVQPSGRGYDLFGPPGCAYVYLIYGMYWMLNVLTEREGVAGCVLIRAVEPVAGEALMWDRRPAARKPTDLTSGPGKLTQALEIDKSFHRTSLLEPPLFFAEPEDEVSHRVGTSSRIGITRAVERQWRFYCDGNPFVSPAVPSDVAAENRRKARRRTRRA